MSVNKQTYVTHYTTDVDPRTLPDYYPEHDDHVPLAARQGSEGASSYTASEGPRQRKKYVTTTVTTVTTTTILLPKMQEAFVLPSVTEHDLDRRIEGDGGRHPVQRALTGGPSSQLPPQVPRALPPPPPQHPAAAAAGNVRDDVYNGVRGSPVAQASQTPSYHRQSSTSDSRRDDSVHHLFPPGSVPSAHERAAEGPGQNPYHSLPLRMDSRGPSSVQSSATKPQTRPQQPPASAPVPRGAHHAAPPHQEDYTNGSRSMNYSQRNGVSDSRSPPPPPPPPSHAHQPYPRHFNEAHTNALVVPGEVEVNPDGTVSRPWVFNQNNTKAVTTTATYDRAPTLEELGITSYFTEQAPTRRSAPYVASPEAHGQAQPWIIDETREELEGGNAYRYQ